MAGRGRGGGRELGRAVRNELADDLTRRELLARGGGFGLTAAIAAAIPVAARMAAPERAVAAGPLDASLQAFFDTIIPGKQVPELRTELGNTIEPGAIAGIDHEHGAVYTDSLLLARDPRLGFTLLEPAFFADLNARALAAGGLFHALDYETRERVCISGLAFSNPDRLVWEAAAAIPFTAFCAAGNVPEATSRTAAGYAVMGHPGTAPHGYRHYSYRRKLNRGRTESGNLP
ncbi:MAG TPA: DUF5987 family protein [Solirubrobacterales bacterium]|nr:DUF5987 family protein [Solirubrobacterales bacterium]